MIVPYGALGIRAGRRNGRIRKEQRHRVIHARVRRGTGATWVGRRPRVGNGVEHVGVEGRGARVVIESRPTLDEQRWMAISLIVWRVRQGALTWQQHRISLNAGS